MSTTPTRTPTSDGETDTFDAPQTLEGRVLDGQYRLEEIIEAGGMGLIFRAHQKSTDRTVAVKILRPTRSDEMNAIRRFSREGELLGRLSHPNIVSLIDSGRDAGGLLYLVMEYVDGPSLREFLADESPTLLELVDIFEKTASALAEAHASHVIHRDLKLDNVVVTRQTDGSLRVTILDFGVAKPIGDADRLELTGKGEVPGTPDVVAPELVEEEPPSPESDLYSLGVLAYSALAGHPPFEARNDLELMRAHKQDAFPSLGERAPDYVPDQLVDLVERMLEKEPEARPENAVEVRKELASIRRTLWNREPAGEPYAPGNEVEPEQRDWEGEIAEGSTGPRKRRREGPLSPLLRSIFGEEPLVAPRLVVIELTAILVMLIFLLVYVIASI